MAALPETLTFPDENDKCDRKKQSFCDVWSALYLPGMKIKTTFPSVELKPSVVVPLSSVGKLLFANTATNILQRQSNGNSPKRLQFKFQKGSFRSSETVLCVKTLNR